MPLGDFLMAYLSENVMPINLSCNDRTFSSENLDFTMVFRTFLLFLTFKNDIIIT